MGYKYIYEKPVCKKCKKCILIQINQQVSERSFTILKNVLFWTICSPTLLIVEVRIFWGSGLSFIRKRYCARFYIIEEGFLIRNSIYIYNNHWHCNNSQIDLYLSNDIDIHKAQINSLIGVPPPPWPGLELDTSKIFCNFKHIQWEFIRVPLWTRSKHLTTWYYMVHGTNKNINKSILSTSHVDLNVFVQIT